MLERRTAARGALSRGPPGGSRWLLKWLLLAALVALVVVLIVAALYPAGEPDAALRGLSGIATTT